MMRFQLDQNQFVDGNAPNMAKNAHNCIQTYINVSFQRVRAYTPHTDVYVHAFLCHSCWICAGKTKLKGIGTHTHTSHSYARVRFDGSRCDAIAKYLLILFFQHTDHSSIYSFSFIYLLFMCCFSSAAMMPPHIHNATDNIRYLHKLVPQIEINFTFIKQSVCACACVFRLSFLFSRFTLTVSKRNIIYTTKTSHTIATLAAQSFSMAVRTPYLWLTQLKLHFQSNESM